MAVLRTTTIALSLSMIIAGSALAGPPLATDDTGTVEVGKLEIELNGTYSDDSETAFGVTTRCNRSDAELKVATGLYNNLGISVSLPYNINERIREDDRLIGKSDGLGDMTIELKHTIAELAGMSFAIKPVFIIPTGKYSAGLSEGRWQFGATLIATREFEEGRYALHANLGYQHHDYRTAELRESTRSGIWSGSLAGEMEVAKKLFAVADFGLATTADRSTRQLSACALTGMRYEIGDHLDVHAGVKLGLTRPEDDLTALYGIVLKY
ncbi:MAG: transporter [Geobacteraceae bacterium]|nr:transporter [Geobacteraceae bacterium]